MKLEDPDIVTCKASYNDEADNTTVFVNFDKYLLDMVVSPQLIIHINGSPSSYSIKSCMGSLIYR